jgi:hypothetical protein
VKSIPPNAKLVLAKTGVGQFNSNKFDVPLLAEEFLRAEIDFDLKNRKLIDVQNIFHKMEQTYDVSKMQRVIQTFNKEEQIQLLKIVYELEPSKISENNNGSFIYMDDLTQETLKKMDSYIEYVLLKEVEIKVMEDELDKLKNTIH